jgi:lysophospholipid hydrolase
MVQVFAQTGHPVSDQRGGSWDEEDMNGYQLLNEVGSGGTLSSLFTILSLFTEDVKMSWQDGEPAEMLPDELSDTAPGPVRNRAQRANSDVSQLDLGTDGPGYHPRRNASFSSSSGSTVHATSDTMSPRSHGTSRYEDVLETPVHSRAPSSAPPQPFSRKDAHVPTQLHHGVVARATEDSTLAVIPAEAFRRLTKKFPKATGHIVQGKPLRVVH